MGGGQDQMTRVQGVSNRLYLGLEAYNSSLEAVVGACRDIGFHAWIRLGEDKKIKMQKKLNALMMTKQERGQDGHCMDSERVICDSIPDCQDGQTMEMSGYKKVKGKPGFTN